MIIDDLTASAAVHDLLTEEASVLLLQGQGCVPVEDGDEWPQPWRRKCFFLMLSTTLLLKENVVHYCTYGEVHVVLMIHKLWLIMDLYMLHAWMV